MFLSSGPRLIINRSCFIHFIPNWREISGTPASAARSRWPSPLAPLTVHMQMVSHSQVLPQCLAVCPCFVSGILSGVFPYMVRSFPPWTKKGNSLPGLQDHQDSVSPFNLLYPIHCNRLNCTHWEFTWWSPNSWYLRMWPDLQIGSLLM